MSAEKKAEAIRDLTAAGFALFPLAGNSKIPKAGFLDWGATPVGKYSEKELALCNYGVALGPNDIVIDVDPRNFKTGDSPLKRLVNVVGAPFDSFVVRTGGGGLHIYFKIAIPDGWIIVGNLKKQGFFGIDTKHQGGYVLGPGSVHPDTGQPYQIVRGTPSRIIAAPSKLVEIVTRPEQTALTAGTGTYLDDASMRQRYASYLRNIAAPSIQGQGGDANAFVVAAHGRDLALPPEIALELMMEHWNERCQPTWTESELRGKVEHAYRYASSPIGGSHPSADFASSPLPEYTPPAPTVTSLLAGLIDEVQSTNERPSTIPEATPPDSPGAKALSDVSTEDVDWAMSANGTVLKNFHNLINYMKAKTGTGLTGIFGYNEFTKQVEFCSPAPWHRGKMPHSAALTDADLKLLKAHLAVRHALERSVTEVEEAVTVVAWGKRFHPVREYLDGLVWDGVSRLDFWLRDHLGVEDSEYSRAVSRKVLCAAVVRVYRPGCDFHQVLVLEGEQGIGKSQVCRILGGEWAADFPVDPHDKDTVQLLQGRWIVELAELEVTGRTETDALKAFISRPSDKVRLAYGRLAVEYPRQSIFIASKNPAADGTYLKDDTGNRRWWPVACKPEGGIVDFKKLKEARNQLWAEAAHRVKSDGGERLYMDSEELKDEARAVAALRHAEHPWVERISTWLDSLRPARDFITARDVFVDALGGIDKQLDRRATVSVAQALRAIGWKPFTHRRVDGRAVRGYVPKVASTASATSTKIAASNEIEDDEPETESLEIQGGIGELGDLV